jgi:hypothetical protein
MTTGRINQVTIFGAAPALLKGFGTASPNERAGVVKWTGRTGVAPGLQLALGVNPRLANMAIQLPHLDSPR